MLLWGIGRLPASLNLFFPLLAGTRVLLLLFKIMPFLKVDLTRRLFRVQPSPGGLSEYIYFDTDPALLSRNHWVGTGLSGVTANHQLTAGHAAGVVKVEG